MLKVIYEINEKVNIFCNNNIAVFKRNRNQNEKKK